MTLVPADKLPYDAAGLVARSDARLTLSAFEEFLKSPAFLHKVDVAVLTKIATDDAMPARERRRAAEVLATLRLRALELFAELTGVREQVLEERGLSNSAPTAVSAAMAVAKVEQVTRVEIVRDDNWRGSGAGDDRA